MPQHQFMVILVINCLLEILLYVLFEYIDKVEQNITEGNLLDMEKDRDNVCIEPLISYTSTYGENNGNSNNSKIILDANMDKVNKDSDFNIVECIIDTNKDKNDKNQDHIKHKIDNINTIEYFVYNLLTSSSFSSIHNVINQNIAPNPNTIE